MSDEGADAVSVGRFAPDDEAGVVALWADVFAGDPPWNEPRQLLARKLAENDGLVFVARAGGRVVGSVLGGYDGVRGWIYHLAVSPALRRRGIATRLMRAVEAALTERGCLKINLQVRATNTPVVAFYQSLGYQAEERLSLGKRTTREG